MTISHASERIIRSCNICYARAIRNGDFLLAQEPLLPLNTVPHENQVTRYTGGKRRTLAW